MGTENSTTWTEVSSSASLPTFEVRHEAVWNTPKTLTTTSTSEGDVYSKEVVIRGTSTRSVKIKVNIAREQALHKNLIANRGPMKVETTASNEE